MKVASILGYSLMGATLIATITYASVGASEILTEFSSKASDPSSRLTSIHKGEGETLEIDNFASNAIEIAYSGISYSGSSFRLPSSSILGNTTPINNLNGLTISGVANLSSFKIEVAYEKGVFAEVGSYSMDSASKSIDLSAYIDPKPRYFKLESTSDELTLSSISLDYGCGIGTNPVNNPGYKESNFIFTEGKITGLVPDALSPLQSLTTSATLNGIDVSSGTKHSNWANCEALSLKGNLDINTGFKPIDVKVLDLKEFTPASLTTNLFGNMADLKEVILGEGVMDVKSGDWFSGCSKIERVFLPSGYSKRPFKTYGYFSGKDNLFYEYTADLGATGKNYWSYNVLGEPFVVSTAS